MLGLALSSCLQNHPFKAQDWASASVAGWTSPAVTFPSPSPLVKPQIDMLLPDPPSPAPQRDLILFQSHTYKTSTASPTLTLPQCPALCSSVAPPPLPSPTAPAEPSASLSTPHPVEPSLRLTLESPLLLTQPCPASLDDLGQPVYSGSLPVPSPSGLGLACCLALQLSCVF